MQYFSKRNIGKIILVIAILANLSVGVAFEDEVMGKNVNCKDIAKRYFDNHNYINAVTWYKKASINAPNDMSIYEQIGNAYWELRNYEIAFNWYKVCNKAEEKLSEADKIFRIKIKASPKDSSNYTGLSWVFLKQGKTGESIFWLKKAIKVNPRDSDIYRGLGWIYAKQKQYTKAIYWFKRAINMDPLNIPTYEGISWVYLEMGNHKQALYWLNEAKKTCVECKRIDEIMARVYTSVGEYNKAESLLQGIVKNLDEGYGYWGCPFQALGELYSHMTISDKRKKVIDNYINSAEKESYRGYVQFETAKICYEYGDYGNAIKYVERAINLATDERIKLDYKILKGFILISLKKYQESLNIFLEITKHGNRGQQLRAQVGFGHIEVTRNNYKLAQEYFQYMLDSDSNDIMANLGMGWVYANQGENQKALVYFDRILKKNKEHMFALSGKGFALIGMGKIEEAKFLFEEAVKIYPNDEYLLNGLAIAKYHLGDIMSSEKYFKVALKQNPTSFTCPYEGLGLVYLKQGKTKEAEENFKKAIAINPNIEYKKYNGLARIYIKQGKTQEAKELLEKSIKNYPYDNEAKKLLQNIDKN